VDYGFHMAITKADAGTFADMQAMVDAGVSTFKVFLAYPNVLIVTDDLFLAVLDRSKETGGLVMVHAENGFAIDHLVKKALAAGDTDPIYHALTRPEEFEAEATGRAIRLAEYVDAPIYIVHVSCKPAVDELIAARARGVPAYGETCIQYLFASIEDLRRPDFEGARYVCSPPLRDASNQPHMWDALNFDHLQSISTDHCPFNDEQKRLGLGDFSKIPNGLAAIQHRLPMLWEHGVRHGRLSMNRVVEITSTAVAKMFGLHPRKGVIAAGADADIVVFDPGRRHVFSTETSFMNVDYDIYEGQEVAGSPRLTLSRGTVVFDDGHIRTKPGHGRYVRRAPFDPSHV
jgi:dihydropyrimidinase